MKNIIFVLVVALIVVFLLRNNELPVFTQSPVRSIHLPTLTPRAKTINTRGISNNIKQDRYVVVGMYDNMLKIAQHKRLWPVNQERYDNCIMLHNYSWICK